MHFSNLFRYAATSGALVAFLAGCAGSGSQTAVPALQNVSGQSTGAQALNAVAFAPKTGGYMEPTSRQTELVYMSSWATASLVSVFTRNGKQVGQIMNGLQNLTLGGLFVDAKSNLWVTAAGPDGLTLVYPRGALSPSTTLTDPLGNPTDVTVCSDGTAYVANLYNNSNSNTASVQVFPPGSIQPTRSLTYSTDFRNPAVACDSAGNVFVSMLTSQNLGSGRVIEFPHGKQKGAKDLGIVTQVPGGIKADKDGNLLVTDLVAETITEYTEKGVPTGNSIATGTNIEGIAVSRDGRVVIGADPDFNQGIAWSFPGGKQLTLFSCCSRIGPPLQNPYGVAIDPGQPGT